MYYTKCSSMRTRGMLRCTTKCSSIWTWDIPVTALPLYRGTLWTLPVYGGTRLVSSSILRHTLDSFQCMRHTLDYFWGSILYTIEITQSLKLMFTSEFFISNTTYHIKYKIQFGPNTWDYKYCCIALTHMITSTLYCCIALTHRITSIAVYNRGKYHFLHT